MPVLEASAAELAVGLLAAAAAALACPPYPTRWP
jgi:hypothetical protein